MKKKWSLLSGNEKSVAVISQGMHHERENTMRRMSFEWVRMENFLQLGNYYLDIEHGHSQKTRIGLPWRSSGWEPAWQCRGHRFNPWSRKILHSEKPSLITTTTKSQGAATAEPMCCNDWSRHTCAAQQEKPLQWAACETQQREPCLLQPESLRTAVRTQSSQTKEEREWQKRVPDWKICEQKSTLPASPG